MKLPAAIVKTWNDIQLNFDAIQKSSTLDHVSVSRIAFFAMPGATYGPATEMPWDGAVDANPAMWTAGADVKLTRSGLWLLEGEVLYQPAASLGSRLCALYVDGVEVARSQGAASATTDADAHQAVCCRQFAAGQLVRVRGYHQGGATLSAQGHLSATWLGN